MINVNNTSGRPAYPSAAMSIGSTTSGSAGPSPATVPRRAGRAARPPVQPRLGALRAYVRRKPRHPDLARRWRRDDQGDEGGHRPLASLILPLRDWVTVALSQSYIPDQEPWRLSWPTSNYFHHLVAPGLYLARVLSRQLPSTAHSALTAGLLFSAQGNRPPTPGVWTSPARRPSSQPPPFPAATNGTSQLPPTARRRQREGGRLDPVQEGSRRARASVLHPPLPLLPSEKY